jgi:DNA-binding transcriptional ArsR family regulator
MSVARATIFSALGDPTRLQLVERLGKQGPTSITALTEGMEMTRQAVTRHLEVLAAVGLVHDVRRGRERLWELDPAPLHEAAGWLEQYRAEWESRFDRLEAFLASPEPQEPE